MKERIRELRQRYAAFGQEHVFRFWERLDSAAQERLATQAERLDLEGVARAHAHSQELAAPGARSLAPAPIELLPRYGGSPERRAEERTRGEASLRAGRVAALVVAGGQGTRLGFDGPKGAFPIGPVTDRCLFEVQAQKLRGARSRYEVALPWYIMTSPATDAVTREIFARHDDFGMPRKDVFFLCQSMVPALNFEGKLILEAPDRIAESPNGHGGTFQALSDSGALDDMERRGIDMISYYQVDNPLVRIVDPIFVGLHEAEGAEMSCKAVRKLDPMEKMGVLALVDRRVGIVEYTEIDDEHRFAKDSRGELVYWAGSPAIHIIDVAFARRMAADADRALPYHASAKKIPYVDEAGEPMRPAKPNGYKLERFLFDALPAARKVAILEVERSEEYSPVKNAEGSDSPETTRASLVAEYRRWLEAGAIEVPEGPIELDHARIDGPEDVVELGIRTLEQAGARTVSEVA